MSKINNIEYAEKLYEKIFKESVVNSKEFINFANGDPHPLRLKIEILLDGLGERFVEDESLSISDRKKLSLEIDEAYELDRIIMEFIENSTI